MQSRRAGRREAQVGLLTVADERADQDAWDLPGLKKARLGSALRGGVLLGAFAGLTLPLMPLQAVLKRVSPSAGRRFPHWYHRRVCRLLGIRIHVDGAVVRDRPVLLISNHTSWLDIPVLSAVAPVSFVAKAEVDGWPGVGTLARLQRTVFVDRTRRTSVGATAGEIAQRLRTGDAIVLFAEGTSSDGNRVLPFRSSLLASVFEADKAAGESEAGPDTSSSKGAMRLSPVVQTVSLVYTRLHGVPLGRADRHRVGWYGDMDMIPHAWQVLKSGPLDVAVHISEPEPLEAFANRKDLAKSAETKVRDNVTRLLRSGQ